MNASNIKQQVILSLTIIFSVFGLITQSGCNRNNSDTAPNDATPAKSTEAADRERGAQIMADYQKKDAAPYRKVVMKLTVNSTSEPTKTYEAEILRKQTPDETLTLTHVTKPSTEKDLASFSDEKKGQRTVNVSYAQATGKFVEYDSSKQGFGGLTVQELLGGELDKYDFKYLGEKTIDGVKAYEIESTLKPGADSTIVRVITLFREDTMLPVELHLFNNQRQEIRTFHITDYRTIDGRPTIAKTVIDNPGRNTKISIELLNVSYPAKIDDKVFTRENLKQLVVR